MQSIAIATGNAGERGEGGDDVDGVLRILKRKNPEVAAKLEAASEAEQRYLGYR